MIIIAYHHQQTKIMRYLQRLVSCGWSVNIINLRGTEKEENIYKKIVNLLGLKNY